MTKCRSKVLGYINIWNYGRIKNYHRLEWARRWLIWYKCCWVQKFQATFLWSILLNWKTDVSTFVSDSSISGEVAYNSATSTLLKHLLNIIGNGVKTKGHIFTEKELNLKFPFVDLIAIERFEEITGIKFDESKFKNRKEFQEYFAKWLDSQRK